MGTRQDASQSHLFHNLNLLEIRYLLLLSSADIKCLYTLKLLNISQSERRAAPARVHPEFPSIRYSPIKGLTYSDWRD